MLAGEDEEDVFWNYFALPLNGNPNVALVSTYDLRSYSKEARVPFSKTVLCLCLGMIIASDSRWNLDWHTKTVGCFFDFCEDRDDIVVGLKKMRFDHKACRNSIKDDELLSAIDAILELKVDFN